MTNPTQTYEAPVNPEAEARLGEHAEEAEQNFFQKAWKNTSEMFGKLVNDPNTRAAVLTMLEALPVVPGLYSLADVALGLDAQANIGAALHIWNGRSLTERLKLGAKGLLQMGAAAIPASPFSGVADRVIQQILPRNR